MTTYYIDYKNGNDTTGDGSTGTPWKTLNKALTTVSNGDTIKVRGDAGDKTTWYRERRSTSLTTLTIEADSGHTPAFVGSVEYTSWSKTDGYTNIYEAAYTPSVIYGCWNGGTEIVSVGSLATCDSTTNSYYFDNPGDKLYINIGGDAPTSIEACTSNAYVLQLTGSGATLRSLIFQHHCQALRLTGGTGTVDLCTLRYWFPAANGTAFSCIYLDTGSTYAITDCAITCKNGANIGHGITADSDVSSITISGCTITSCINGIDINGGTGHLIHDCIVSDSNNWCVIADGNSTGTIYNVTCHNYDYGGIKVGSAVGETTNAWTIHHCTVYDETGDSNYGYNSDGGDSNWYHNIAYNITVDGWILQTDGTVNASNNISAECGGNGYYAAAAYTPTLTADYNCSYNNGTAYSGDWSQGENDVTSDPTFTNAASADFTLQDGSPCIDAGVAVAGINDGYSGTAPDIGRYEVMAGTANLLRGKLLANLLRGKL